MKPTKEQLADYSKWRNHTDAMPQEDGFYACMYDDSGPYWLKFVGGRWSHGGSLWFDSSEGAAEHNASRGSFIQDSHNVKWFSQEPDLFD